MRHRLILLLLTTLGGITWATPGFSHGVSIQYQILNSVEIQARYDSGEPLKEAQVVIYAPENPTEPWITGTTDTEGYFVFTPDLALPGTWEVAVRQAGHGEIVSIPVMADGLTANSAIGTGNEASADSSTPASKALDTPDLFPRELSPVQRWLMIGAVIWGFVGTALFFSRGKR
jgi:nickel transport protein